MLRKFFYGLIAVSVVLFGVSFMKVVTSLNPDGWNLGIPISLIAFVIGICGNQFAIPGIARAQGPTSFGALDVSGALAAPVKHQVDRPVKRWTRTWMTLYFWTGLGEVFLGGLFIVAGPSTDGPDSVRQSFFGTGAFLAAVGVVCLYVAYRAYNKDKLHTTGIDGTATIVGVSQTGAWANNNPVTVLDCKIHVDGHPDYEVRHRETVPQVAIGSLTNGATLPVKVNPKNPSDFIIQWEQM